MGIGDKPPCGAPRPIAGVVLLNLTGLGLGYLYAKSWRRGLIHLAVTVALVAIAFATQMVRFPLLWLIVLFVWWLWMAFDGWRLARRLASAAEGQVMGQRWPPALVAVGLLVLEIAALMVYGSVGRKELAAGMTAYNSADCRAALQHFYRATTFYRLTLGQDRAQVDEQTIECALCLTADNAREQAAYPDAVDAYEAYLSLYPGGGLAPVVREGVAATRVEWAAALGAEERYAEAIEQCQIVLGDYADTHTGRGAAGRVVGIYDAWAATLRDAGQYTAAIEKYQAILSEYPEYAAVSRAAESIAATRLEWAAQLRLVGDCESAIAQYQIVLEEQANTSLAAEVREGIAAARQEWAAQLRQAGDYERAIAQYQTALEEQPGILATVREEIAATYLEWAAALEAAEDFREAIGKYEAVRADYADTRAGGQVASLMVESCGRWVEHLLQANDQGVVIGEHWTVLALCPDSATARIQSAIRTWYERAQKDMQAGRYCDAVPTMRNLAAANGLYVTEATTAVSEALYQCGVTRHRAGEFQAALLLYDELLRDYPDSLQVDQARAARRAIEVDRRVADVLEGLVREIEPFESSGYARSGSAVLEIVNDSTRNLEILVSVPGPESASFSVEACADCTAYSILGPLGGCRWSAPGVEIELRPGVYTIIIIPSGGTPLVIWSWELENAIRYEGCYYVTAGE